MFRNLQLGSLFKMDKFKMVYWAIAIATAQHTAWGAATTMQGAQPIEGMQLAGWWVQGLFFAIAIDYTMVMVATKVRSGTSASQYIDLKILRIPINWYTLTFVAVAILSSYFQLLYAWVHSSQLLSGGGVTIQWTERLQSLIDARIVIAPFALPIIATLYTIGGLGKGGEAQSKPRNVAQPSQSSRNVDATDAIYIDTEQPQQHALSAPKLQLPAPKKLLDSSGKLRGYICPGCGVDLSVSGWSRHKKTCEHLNILVEK